MASSCSLRLLLISLLLCIFSLKSVSLNYYWIGNSGNWSELSHWATTSGGTTLHTQIPTALDDVYFDANSFTMPGQSVNFDALSILAHDINWSGVTNTPALNGLSFNIIRIYGSLTFVPGMLFNFSGPVFFEATTAGQTIRSAGKVFQNDVAFNGIGGTWTLQDALRSNLKVSLNAGVLNTNDQTLSALQFWSISNTSRELIMGSSVFNLAGSSGWFIENAGFTVQCGTSVINLTGSTAIFEDNSIGAVTYYDINFTGIDAGTIDGTENFHDVVFSDRGRIFNAGSFHNVTFLGDGEIVGDNVYNNLEFTAGYTYLLGQGSTQTVNGTLTATGTCGSLISINSNFPGYASTINHPPSNVNISFTILRDIHATGGANFTATNSTDLGNNTGWTFISPGIQNLYWIGNGGDWGNGNHWSHTSGGAPSGCAPTPLDNVFFDANSFSSPSQTVYINVITANCRNMDWTGVTNSPTLSSISNLNDLNIYGSLKFAPAMNLTFNGKLFFQATSSGHTITSAGKVIINETRFNGATGEWTLLDTFNSDSSVIFNCGTLNTNDQIINADDFSSGNFFPRILNMGSSVFNLHGSNAWTVGGGNLIFNCGTSVINLTNDNSMFRNNTQDINTYYNVNFTGLFTGTMVGTAHFNNVVFSAKGTVLDSCRFHTATFLGDGDILNNNVYDDLHFSAGHTYRLWMNSIQKILGSIHASGTCESLLTISSNITDSSTAIHQLSGPVNISYVVMKDIHAQGTASYAASNSVDLGNNTGWIFNVPGIGQNLYWIGNGGNWEDGNHWSLSSGGPPVGCAPTPFDNVFFDVNSFSANGQNVRINVTTAYCRNMDWTGSLHQPIFEAGDIISLKIYGSLTFISAMTMNFLGKLNFEATTTGQTVNTAGKPISNEVAFNGVGGEWTLMSTLNTGNIIYLNNGTLNTNNQTVNTFGLHSTLNSTRALNIGSSVFNISESPSWLMLYPGLSISIGNSVINCTNPFAGQFIDQTGNENTYYDINFTGQLGLITGSANFHDIHFTGKGIIFDSCNIHLADFQKDGDILSDNVYEDLHFSAGFNYRLWKNTTQTVNGTFTATGDCGSLMTISSNMADSTATINHPPGNVNISYVALKDIHATGGATFTADNCLDLGNNTGWTINPSPNLNLYWIGNSGDWNDGNHWSLTSGGPPSGCTPTAINNVFFDANSFSATSQVVLINVLMADCRNMNWTGVTNTPTFGSSANSNQLNIYGSLTFAAGMNMGLAGGVNFEAVNSGQTITMNGRIFSIDVAFNGSGEWILQDGFAANDILFNNGTLNTNGQPVAANNFVSTTNYTRTLNMGSSVFSLSADSAWRVENTGLLINSGTSLVIFTGADASLRDNSNPIHTYYDVQFTGGLKNNIIGTSNFHNVSFASHGYILQSNSFNDVTFNGDGQVESNNVFHDLNFTSGFSYILWEGTTQTVNNRWRIQGSCTEYILLQTNNAGFLATVSCTADSVFGHNIHLRDIHGTGNAAFMAYNSVDLGGNAGWNFTILPPLTNVANINGPTTVCALSTGIIYQVSPVQGAISYQWTVPSGATITGGQGTNTITVDFGNLVSGSITVQACGGCGCSNTSISAPIVISSPAVLTVTISANPGTTVCPATVVAFTATANNAGTGTINYDFKVNGTSVQNGPSGIYSSTVVNGDVITCDITVTGSSCITTNTATSNSITMLIDVNAGNVNVDAGTNVSISTGETIQLNGAGDAGTYLWTPSAGLSATNILNPIASPAVTTIYTLTITNASGCLAFDDIKVEVKDIPNTGCILEPSVAFTPNGDGVNDRWIVWKGNCSGSVRVNVFNRYGSTVFQSQQYQNDWQGMYKGKTLPDGTYYFIAEYKLNNGQIFIKRNNVTILR